MKICQQKHYYSTLDSKLLVVDFLEDISFHGRVPLDYYFSTLSAPHIPQLYYTFAISKARKSFPFGLLPKI